MAIVEFETTASAVYVTANTVTNFEGYAVVADGTTGSTALIANNTLNAGATGAPAVLVDNGSFNVSGNKISHVSWSGTQGASQVVCGTGSYLSCGASTLSVKTAAIQAVSEGAGGPTDLTLFHNRFVMDRLSLATLSMPTGAVTVQWI
jgi:hypothetical protein